MKRFKLKNVAGLALTLCLTLAVMVPTAFAAVLPLNTGSYSWSLSTPGIPPLRHEWNGKSESKTWVLSGGGSYNWSVTVNASAKNTLYADLRKIVPLDIDPTIRSNNFAASTSVSFVAETSSTTYYAVLSQPWNVTASGTTSVY